MASPEKLQPDASPVATAAHSTDGRLFVAMAAIAALVVIVGFSPTLYLRAWFDTPPLSALRYVHGALMTLWYTLFVSQVWLVSRNRIDLHRRFGVLAALTALVLIPVAAATAVAFISRVAANPEDATVAAVIAGYDFVSLFVFALLVSAALALRSRSDIHKRLMTLASLSLLGPAFARLVPDEYAVWLTYLVVGLPIVVDTWRNRRLHPAFLWGGALVLIGSRMGLHFALSPGWIHFALRTFA